MGTDIHGKLQRKNYEGKWVDIGPIPLRRNYRLFAALADVRNGYGFAGVETHEPLTPIAEPRGLPEDVAGWDYGDHSFSWLSIKEILEYDGWDKPLSEVGTLTREQYEKWDGKSVPKEWSGGCWGHGVVMTDDPNTEGWTHIQVKFQGRTLKDACKVFWLWLEWIKLEYDWEIEKDNLRMVFGFDS